MADLGHQQTDKQLQNLEKRIEQVYRQATRETQKKLNDYMKSFKAKDKKKQADLAAGRITQQQYTQWRIGQIAVGKRWEEMRDTLSQDFNHANQIAMSLVNGQLPDVYAINHNFAAYQLEHDTCLDMSFTLYDHRTVERLIRDDPQLLPSPRVDIPKDLQWNQKKVHNAVLQGILQGESIDHMARRLRGVANMNMKAAVRNARTAVTGAENAGRIDSYMYAGDLGIDVQQQWMATLDNRTRDSHRELDGEIVKVGGMFSNGCRYPGDPNGPPEEVYNCRCTLVPVVKGVDQSNAPRNSKLGDMTYEEWKGNHTVAFDEGEQTDSDYEVTVDDCSILHRMYDFNDGTVGGVRMRAMATIYETPDGVKFIFPNEYDRNHQTMTIEQALSAYSRVPRQIREMGQKEIIFQDVCNPQDAYWQKVYKNFRHSYATGGSNITFWRYDSYHDEDYLIRTYCHECGHFIDINNAKTGAKYSQEQEWLDAMAEDLRNTGHKSPTRYGENSPVEDMAESIAEYVGDKNFAEKFPARARILKKLLKM